MVSVRTDQRSPSVMQHIVSAESLSMLLHSYLMEFIFVLNVVYVGCKLVVQGGL